MNQPHQNNPNTLILSMAALLTPINNNKRFIKSIGSDKDAFLRIPEQFQRLFLRPLPRHVTLQTPDGKLWVIGTLAYQGIAYFAAGWKAFKNEYGLVKDDTILADFDRESHFLVAIFNKNSLEKHIPPNMVVLGQDPYQSNTKRYKLTDDADDSDSDSEAEVQDKFEAVLSAMTPPIATERKEPEDAIANQTYKPLTASERGTLYGVHVPYCYVVIFKSCVEPCYELKLPTDFSRSELTPGLTTIKLKRQGFGIWTIICSMTGNRGIILDGWKKFAIDNELTTYEQCAFERNITNAAIWNVTIFRKN